MTISMFDKSNKLESPSHTSSRDFESRLRHPTKGGAVEGAYLRPFPP